MPTNTSNQGFPLPVDGDDPNIPDDLSNLTLAIERRVVGVYNSVADRDARATGPQEGQVAFLKDTNSFTFFDGTAWQPMFPQQVTITSGTTVPSNTSGANGDVFLKI